MVNSVNVPVSILAVSPTIRNSATVLTSKGIYDIVHSVGVLRSVIAVFPLGILPRSGV